MGQPGWGLLPWGTGPWGSVAPATAADLNPSFEDGAGSPGQARRWAWTVTPMLTDMPAFGGTDEAEQFGSAGWYSPAWAAAIAAHVTAPCFFDSGEHLEDDMEVDWGNADWRAVSDPDRLVAATFDPGSVEQEPWEDDQTALDLPDYSTPAAFIGSGVVDGFEVQWAPPITTYVWLELAVFNTGFPNVFPTQWSLEQTFEETAEPTTWDQYSFS